MHYSIRQAQFTCIFYIEGGVKVLLQYINLCQYILCYTFEAQGYRNVSY